VPGGQTIEVVPATHLKSGQMVQIHGAGFTSGSALQVIECADKGRATGPGDCNLAGMLTTAADAAGRVTVRLAVVQGPFGTNRIVCGSRQRCLVSITQASLAPTEEADAPISFAPQSHRRARGAG
jgi:predicted RecA/RadA family phage recombinase